VTSSLYDDAGGLDGLRLLSNRFYDRVLADELLAPVFANFTRAHVEHVAVWLAEVFGGPAGYTAELGGHHALLTAHLGLAIRDEHRERWLALMSAAIDEVYPGQPELAKALLGYFDWGTAIAEEISQDPVGTDLGEPGPTPRWNYQGLVHRPAPS
jgi:hemoglobin